MNSNSSSRNSYWEPGSEHKDELECFLSLRLHTPLHLHFHCFHWHLVTWELLPKWLKGLPNPSFTSHPDLLSSHPSNLSARLIFLKFSSDYIYQCRIFILVSSLCFPLALTIICSSPAGSTFPYPAFDSFPIPFQHGSKPCPFFKAKNTLHPFNFILVSQSTERLSLLWALIACCNYVHL